MSSDEPRRLYYTRGGDEIWARGNIVQPGKKSGKRPPDTSQVWIVRKADEENAV